MAWQRVRSCLRDRRILPGYGFIGLAFAVLSAPAPSEATGRTWPAFSSGQSSPYALTVGQVEDQARRQMEQQVRRQYPHDTFVLGVGEGELSNGRRACRRIAEVDARARLAESVSVEVTALFKAELKESTGQGFKQNIEEMMTTYTKLLLQESNIVDTMVDQAAGICISAAVMEKDRIKQTVSEKLGEVRARLSVP
jgi:hypothetical protein